MNDDEARYEQVVAAAHEALRRGWAPIPVRDGSKVPLISGWQRAPIDTHERIDETWQPGCGLGLVLGTASGGLVDLDLELPEAVEAARVLGPHTAMIHGREGLRASHRWFSLPANECSFGRVQWWDRTDGVLIAELRADGHQTVVPPTRHVSAELYRWDHEGEPAPTTFADLRKNVSDLVSAVLIARWWPPTGARHNAALALAGGLLRGGVSVERAEKIVEAVCRAAGDPEVGDRVACVRSTARRVEVGEQVVGWTTLAEMLTEPAVAWAAASTLDAWAEASEAVSAAREKGVELDGEPEGLRHRRDLGVAITEGVPEPPQVVPDLLYAGALHWWQGEPESGKTLLLLAVALEVARSGGQVMFVDEESGLNTIADRLIRLGATPEDVTRIAYYEQPVVTLSDEDVRAVRVEAQTVKPDLVIFDAAANMLANSRADEDSNHDVTRWIRVLPAPLAHAGSAVVVVDHLVKSAENRGGYARGAGAKKAQSDVAWELKAKDRFGLTPPRVGTVEATIRKDRLGRLPSTRRWRVGGQPDGSTVVEPIETSATTPEEEITAEITALLRARAPEASKALSTREVVDAIGKRKATVIEVLNTIAESPIGGVMSRTEGRARKWWAAPEGEEGTIRVPHI